MEPIQKPLPLHSTLHYDLTDSSNTTAYHLYCEKQFISDLNRNKTKMTSTYTLVLLVELEDLTLINQMTGLKRIVLSKYFRQSRLDQRLSKYTATLGVVSIKCSELQLQCLDGIEHLTNLIELECSDNTIVTLDAVASLQYLQYINASRNSIQSIQPICNLTNLVNLDVSHNHLQDITPLSSLKHLLILNISNNEITTLKPIKLLFNLTILNCSNNLLPKLKYLDLLVNIITLNVSHNRLTDLKHMELLANLAMFKCKNNHVTSLDPLRFQRQLTILDIRHNQIKSIEPIKSMPLIQLDFAFNKVESLKPIKYMRTLKTLNCSCNNLTTLNDLSHHTNTTVYFYNSNLQSTQGIIHTCKPNALAYTLINPTFIEKVKFLNYKEPTHQSLFTHANANTTSTSQSQAHATEYYLKELANLIIRQQLPIKNPKRLIKSLKQPYDITSAHYTTYDMLSIIYTLIYYSQYGQVLKSILNKFTTNNDVYTAPKTIKTFYNIIFEKLPKKILDLFLIYDYYITNHLDAVVLKIVIVKLIDLSDCIDSQT